MNDPAPPRVGSVDWLAETGGRLTGAERRRLTRVVLGAQGRALVGRLRLATGRRGAAALELEPPPDSRLMRLADEAAAEDIETRIIQEWSKSGSAAMDLLLQRGREALQ